MIPGDVYHADFIDGRPGYFDVTIRNSAAFLYIESSDQSWCSSRSSGMRKRYQYRHETNVTTAGGLFYPLVFESLGFISSFTLTTLKEICSKTSAISRVPFPRALKNILEQLSVKLWCYNAKMLHARMQLEVLDVGCWDLAT